MIAVSSSARSSSAEMRGHDIGLASQCSRALSRRCASRLARSSRAAASLGAAICRNRSSVAMALMASVRSMTVSLMPAAIAMSIGCVVPIASYSTRASTTIADLGGGAVKMPGPGIAPPRLMNTSVPARVLGTPRPWKPPHRECRHGKSP